jgi:hypothetical protein
MVSWSMAWCRFVECLEITIHLLCHHWENNGSSVDHRRELIMFIQLNTDTIEQRLDDQLQNNTRRRVRPAPSTSLSLSPTPTLTPSSTAPRSAGEGIVSLSRQDTEYIKVSSAGEEMRLPNRLCVDQRYHSFQNTSETRVTRPSSQSPRFQASSWTSRCLMSKGRHDPHRHSVPLPT